MSMAAALDTYMTGAFSSVHTSIPATVVKYDEGSHRAQVKPSVRMLMDNGIQIELPELMDVPVVFPSGKFFDLEFPLDKGDGVLLLFAEQDISSWKKGDSPAVPATASRFNLDAAIAIPGCSPKPSKGKARISIDKDEKAWRKALQEEGMAWPNFRDQGVADLFKVKSVPTVYLLDSEGKIVASNMECRGEALGEKLKELLK